MSENMREEFEIWAKQKGLSIGLNWNNSYSHVALIAWDAWQSSRESIAVQLPYVSVIFEGSDQDNDMIEACREAIHAAGVKTK